MQKLCLLSLVTLITACNLRPASQKTSHDLIPDNTTAAELTQEAKDRLGLEIIALVTNPPEAMFNEMQEIPDKTMAAAIQKLIAQGANINIQDDNLLTPLHHIINSGSDIVFEAFLENNPDVNLADDSLETPLFYAIKAQNPLMVKLLLKHQADPNVRNIFQ